MGKKTNFRGSIIAGTGFGKSRCGVLAVKQTLSIFGGNALILVPTTQLQKQFKEEFIKWAGLPQEYCEKMLEKINIICYQSAYKLKRIIIV